MTVRGTIFQRLAVLALSGAAVAAALTGCSTSGTEEPTPDSTPTPQVEGNQRDFENSTKIAACLTEKGWEVTVTPAGGWGIEAAFPPEQSEIFQADYSACVDEAGLADVKMTEALASEAYDNNVRVVECLEKEGFSTAERPSRSTFITKMVENPDGDNWNPYSLVSENDIGSAVSACPQ